MKVIQINKKIIISWLLVVLWGCLIFYMSSMDVNESNNKSKETINKIIATSADVNNESETSEKNEASVCESDGYEEKTFTLPPITGKKKVSFVFLPGCNFDFKWFRFYK